MPCSSFFLVDKGNSALCIGATQTVQAASETDLLTSMHYAQTISLHWCSILLCLMVKAKTGLALTPFCGHAMDTSLDWAVAWSLIGEWTTRTIFLPPKGEWPRQGHPKNLLPPYDQRSVPMLAWARACFEQGSLPSLLALPGDASLLVLPGDGMFRAQRIADGKCRQVILHGYGGAKKEMPDSLAAPAKFGWIPMAAAMVGTASSPPLWTGQDWRPILGTSVDTRILPPHLSSKESLPSPGGLAMIHILRPLSRPVFADGGRLSGHSHRSHRSFNLLPRVPRSPTASLGPRNTFTLRASRLVRLLLGAPFPVPSLSCFSLLYETVGTAAGTVLQGSCHWFVIGESAGLSFSIFDSSLVGSFLLLVFHPALPFFLGLAVLADASTAFAIVSHPNHIQIFYFTAQSALYAASKGLFPNSLTCANTSQLNPYRNASGPVVSHACSRRCHH